MASKMAIKFGKLTSNHFETWIREVYYPNWTKFSFTVRFMDWIIHCPDIIQRNRPDSKDIVLLTIPAGTQEKYNR